MLTGSRRAVWARAKVAVRGSAQLAYASPAAQRVAMPAAPLQEMRIAQHNEGAVRSNWTREEVAAIYNMPFTELLFRAASVHRVNFDPLEVQRCTLLSIKTGGCTEDCKYCAQSTRHKTAVKATPMMQAEEVLEAARRAKLAGSTRFCMGTAWRELGAKKTAFKRILGIVRDVKKLDLEVCCTLGMLNKEQASQLKEAGLDAYNHNLDTSREHYPKVISTRTYDERLQTIANVREAGISVCCGGILGLGESEADRIGLLHELASLEKHPESVPINALVPVEGTPLGEFTPPDCFQMARTIATARILMPRSMVRLSAGRLSFSALEQAVMFMAGANSIFTGDKLLTTPNPAFDADMQLFDQLGLKGLPPRPSQPQVAAS
jgi:biotin synthase